MVQLNDARAATASPASRISTNAETRVSSIQARRPDNVALEELFARLGISTEHACTTATSFMCMLVAVENTSTSSPGQNSRYEVFFTPEDDFCGLSEDDLCGISENGDSSSSLVDSHATTMVVVSTGNPYSSPMALTASSNTMVASTGPAFVPSSLAPASPMMAVVASTVAPAAPPAVGLAGTTTALPATPLTPAPVSNNTLVMAVGVTALTAALYALPFIRPPNAPLNAIPPPSHLITPTYGYHVPAANAAAPFYTITCGRDIGIFAGWETASPLVGGVSHFTCCWVASIAEGHSRMAAALAANFAMYLS
ncbi:uncharacterized protein LACBIDRAFT_304671 [Laccaria bicolor S238N-H82]|uniref:Predicted protein n=1 Tax=Laccaria bicolor (strain S238N-H82 / ATCC MYA-4686) TaxID=486041 RepID=B0DM46_LACBS|nr:uncharacterized protein LACBIDRAFT_304671 [Laccaria bicolor S238N-H82]EDR04408.1 predicted protein [Laccaria bicolor S238N-H82]|eukprot:XP_001884927.1 predicted protein [Laccaria bicolor S238N-H82]